MVVIKKKEKLQSKSEQQEAKELMRQVQLIVENSHDAIIGETLDGIITSWNGGAEKMFGYSAEEMIGKSILLLIPPEFKDEVPTVLKKIKAGEVIADLDSVKLRKDGSRIDTAHSISPVKTEDGTIIGVSVVERDITARKKSELQIRELNEVRNKFITIISHQLRTPLTAINWNLDAILRGDFGKLDDIQHKFLQVTYSASLKITRRIHNLLTAIDVEEGRINYEMEEIDLNNLCVGVVNEMRNECEMKNLSCVYTPPTKDLPVIHGDGQKIRTVIATLLENAIGYTKDGGKITATLQLKDGIIRFEITDTGIGIPQTEQHRIFTRFFRASNAAIMQSDAFGLGLYVAKNFIEQHRGKIGFESKEGSGSTFWFELPLKN